MVKASVPKASKTGAEKPADVTMAMEMQSIRISIPGFVLAQEDALIVDMTLYCTRPKTPLNTPIVSEDGSDENKGKEVEDVQQAAS